MIRMFNEVLRDSSHSDQGEDVVGRLESVRHYEVNLSHFAEPNPHDISMTLCLIV